MNRKDRRSLAKKIASGKYGEKMKFKQAWKDVTEQFKIKTIEEGATVMLNYSWIKNQPDFKFQPKEFWDWLEENKNGVFHVKYDKELVEKNNQDYTKFVCLEEDETEPRWVMRSDALIPVKVKLDSDADSKNDNTEDNNTEVETFEEVKTDEQC